MRALLVAALLAGGVLLAGCTNAYESTGGDDSVECGPDHTAAEDETDPPTGARCVDTNTSDDPFPDDNGSSAPR